ncbi:GNAT family N-acetyltransferase [Altererythrobacter sp. CC-YST694]|uniref:GNAT family N-acetyltransferase n=1 Tax=Altererythrobacter sp. CC-YST694 TaxID=2755038 RepID=UPI001D0212E3|nr:GNAT family N-acetyltransferase [Altererythrobacter sp. CC-YST694]MCB5426194.1 GNAT family N-acetyltransferase [Altererythrobacter sp. CC-YST694]
MQAQAAGSAQEQQALAGVFSGSRPLASIAGDSALLRDWERLESCAPLPTQAHAFVAALAVTLLAETAIEIFTAPGLEGIGALLPLCRAPGHFTAWRMAGAREVFEPIDALCESAAAARGMADRLASQPRALWFERVPAESPLIPAMKEAMKGKGVLSVRPAVPCPMIALDESWHEPEGRFNSGRRSDFRRAARKAEQMGKLSYQVISPTPDSFDALFDEAVAVELCSWKKEAGTAIASQRAKEDFFRTYFRAACANGEFRLSFLRIDGRAAAMQMAVVRGGRYWLFKIGFDEAYCKCSPGTLLMLHTLGWAAREGLESYELMGGVEPWIAEFWTRDQHETMQLRAYPFSLVGMGALLIEASRWLGRRVARAVQ